MRLGLSIFIFIFFRGHLSVVLHRSDIIIIIKGPNTKPCGTVHLYVYFPCTKSSIMNNSILFSIFEIAFYKVECMTPKTIVLKFTKEYIWINSIKWFNSFRSRYIPSTYSPLAIYIT